MPFNEAPSYSGGDRSQNLPDLFSPSLARLERPLIEGEDHLSPNRLVDLLVESRLALPANPNQWKTETIGRYVRVLAALPERRNDGFNEVVWSEMRVTLAILEAGLSKQADDAEWGGIKADIQLLKTMIEKRSAIRALLTANASQRLGRRKGKKGPTPCLKSAIH